jgi:hypothetical protein
MCVDEFTARHVILAGKNEDNTIRYAVVKKPTVNTKNVQNLHNAVKQPVTNSQNMQVLHDAVEKAHEEDRQSYWKRNAPEW